MTQCTVRRGGAARACPALFLLLLLLPAALPAQAPPPDARWSSFETEHFRVTYQEGVEPTARRAAERIERAYVALARELVPPPRARIDLVVADNVDLANGYATQFPTNRIVIYAHPPADEPSLSYSDDWVELLVTHELTHVVHRDYTRGVWQGLRSLLGRNPGVFPEMYVPDWVTEGLATYYESRLTGSGRVRGTYFDMVLRTAILQDAFFPLDQATGDPATWPAGSTRYVYGALFLDFLGRRYGAERIPAFVRTVGHRWIPYRVDAAARHAFGVSFSHAWGEWEDSLRARYTALSDSLRAAGVTEPELLSVEGRGTGFPRFAPAGGALAYSSATGREDLTTRLLGAGGERRALAARNSVGPSTWERDGEAILLAQLHWKDPNRMYSDLYRLHLDGRTERLTRDERLGQPDLHPDGRRLLVVADAGGSNVLAVRDLGTGATRRLTEPSLDVQWAAPRWSPTGDRIAVGRWRTGGFYDVVVLDSAGTVLRELTADRAIDREPAWSPDGRYVVFSSDRTGIPNLFAYDLEQDRLLQATSVLTGAFQPDVSPDGRWIAFAYYLADGFHIARVAFDPAGWRPAPPVRPEMAEPARDTARFAASAGGPSRPYSPRASLAPAGWTPLLASGTALGVGVGAAVGGVDLVARHSYALAATLHPEGTRVEAAAGYAYRRWLNPVLTLAASQEWRVDAAAGRLADAQGAPIPSALLRRDRSASAALAWTRPRWRSRSWASVGGELRDRAREWDDPAAADRARGFRLDYPLDLGAVLSAGYSSARGYSFSIGPQEGVYASARLEGRRYLEPFAGESDTRGYARLTEHARAYHGFRAPGFARHVLALRLDAGVESGSHSPGFEVGGASGGSSPLGVELDLLGGGLAYPLRGYGEGVQQGTRAFSASAEYRFPLALVERGVRALPLFLDRLSGTLFADAAGAWCPGACERRFLNASPRLRPLASAGGELVADLQVGYFVPLTLRAGAAFPLRDAGPHSGPQLYLRVGRAF